MLNYLMKILNLIPIVLTVSRESAPRSLVKLLSGLTLVSAGKTSCFLTMLITLSTVSVFACSCKINQININSEKSIILLFHFIYVI